ncbi:MAG: nitrate transporter substrate-binding protein [Bacillota bacterium]|nr:nitrate transporter substrate-binding protein [Bacillota bacterium]
MKLFKSKFFALTAVLALSVFTLTACSQNKVDEGNKEKAAEEPNEKIRIVLDWTPNTNHTGLYVAQSKGFFAEQGLDVEIMQPPEGGAETLVGAGDAEFGISFQDSLAPNFASENQVPVTAVAALIQHNTSGIISLKEKGIDTPSKMSGHSYATWDMPIEKAIIKKIVEEDGGKFEDIKMIPSTVTDVVTALQTDVDSVWVFYAWDGIATKVKGIETNYLNFADYGTELDFYSPVLIAGNDFLQNNPETVKKALLAIKKGYEFAIENPEEAADILLEQAPELDSELVKESQKWLADQYIADATQWGYIDPNRWDGFYGWLFKNNLIEKEIPKGTGFANEFLPE